MGGNMVAGARDGFTAPGDLERTFDSLFEVHWLLVHMVEDDESISG